MDDIQAVIKILAQHNYRSVSNVVGEYVEKRVALALNGQQAKHCQKGFDVFSQELGRVEVKARNFYAKSYLCQLPEGKLENLDHFILVITKAGEIERALLYSREILLEIQSKSGKAYVDKRNFDLAKDITSLFRNQSQLP